MDEPVLLAPERRTAVAAGYEAPDPWILAYALDEILAEKARAVLERGKARDYYDVWRLMGEKRDALDLPRVRTILLAKCAHRGIAPPVAHAFFPADALAQVEAFWMKDLADQVAPGELPPLPRVLEELGALLAEIV